jgi:hypothetical protein
MNRTDIENASDAQLTDGLLAAQKHNPATGHAVDIDTVILIREERRRRQLQQQPQGQQQEVQRALHRDRPERF